LAYDDHTGTPLNTNYIDYKMPLMLDYPEITPILLEVWRGAGEYGACGMAEGTGTGTLAAIGNAIYNAIGVRLDGVPFKPEKILAALDEKEAVK
ncbi:MAG: xanthine dehydrogenase family protein molybdopterin-binding subunit, partial [Clostridia bacterium]|nr:xanthine dehydrogenase family protein molybdopterin-binding subunit [Clostridia bacterium]